MNKIGDKKILDNYNKEILDNFYIEKASDEIVLFIPKLVEASLEDLEDLEQNDAKN